LVGVLVQIKMAMPGVRGERRWSSWLVWCQERNVDVWTAEDSDHFLPPKLRRTTLGSDTHPLPAYIPRCSRWSSCCCQRLSVAHQPQPLLSTPLLFLWAQLRPSHSPVTPVVHNQHRHPVHFSSCTPQTHVVSCVKSGPNDWTTSISPH
jgi:hypothetical protein